MIITKRMVRYGVYDDSLVLCPFIAKWEGKVNCSKVKALCQRPCELIQAIKFLLQGPLRSKE